MADKTSTGTYGSAAAVGSVTTAGTVATNVVTVVFDEASEMGTVIDNLEKCKVQIIDYYNNKS